MEKDCAALLAFHDFPTPVVHAENKRCWVIEQPHRVKQLTGIEKCQCRKQRATQSFRLLLSGVVLIKSGGQKSENHALSG
ncbi:MAG: hypothetical protein IPK63_04435 [Candidatus Competibacteraceae bacterium]|nr:hypothetical protein [Candidatus Competibacteraceae bacterium]